MRDGPIMLAHALTVSLLLAGGLILGLGLSVRAELAGSGPQPGGGLI